jgi:hypothetical protein
MSLNGCVDVQKIDQCLAFYRRGLPVLKELFSASVRFGLVIFLTASSAEAADEFKLPAEMPQEGSRDVNLIQIEPTVINEKYYTSGGAERHQKTSPTLPYGAEIPDTDDVPSLKGAKAEKKTMQQAQQKNEIESNAGIEIKK